ncbi:sigma-54-dependent transcriptional regulator [Desulfovibrio psychrotolerans]|uniref:Sigma-54-dependent Fis family transcriptional regulator n=1 Tax=Desulfovibrio psychrotolerans TaxID=415242 RepID=A0A7J0BTF9_9BACT|nr:sigma-54 dependent transcriptional regulator [Desulfovibrio psychrotolerans]GFM37006.1 sigma-54-dependent Fis family transcriptional regulator [Desulfovibrio psychrotolerans]
MHHTPAEHILLIEDDPAFGAMLTEALDAKGYSVHREVRAEDALQHLRDHGSHGFDLILTDVKLPGMSGLEAIPRLRQMAPESDIIVMTAFSTKEMAVEAVRQGAYDFFSKPFSLGELEVVVRRCMEKRRLQSTLAQLRSTLLSSGPAGCIIGESSAIREVKERIERIAPLDTTVLILGESGTGKELISDTVHALSPRAGNPFIRVNCAAIPENLFENELFGHEKGAFTGAAQAQAGKFEQADKGTILLDEIGDMPLSIQPKLLRVVEQKQVERLGGRRPVNLDVRIIAATNQHLEDLIREKRFREDLYYRLNVAVIHLPPLRHRREDIIPLAHHFLNRIRRQLALDVDGFTPQAESALQRHDWPGNVRQLANVLEGLAISAAPGRIEEHHVLRALGNATGRNIPSTAPHAIDLREAVEHFEKTLILNALRRTGGSQKDAATLLALNPKNLWAKMRKHAITPDDIAVCTS